MQVGDLLAQSAQEQHPRYMQLMSNSILRFGHNKNRTFQATLTQIMAVYGPQMRVLFQQLTSLDTVMAAMQ